MDLIQELSKLSPTKLEEVVKQAKLARAEQAFSEIPKEKLATLVDLWHKVQLGKEITLKFNLPINLEIAVGNDHSEFGEVVRFTLNFDTDSIKDSSEKEIVERFVKYYTGWMNDMLLDDVSALSSFPGVGELCEQQSKIYHQFEIIEHELRTKYNIDVHVWLENGSIKPGWNQL